MKGYWTGLAIVIAVGLIGFLPGCGGLRPYAAPNTCAIVGDSIAEMVATVMPECKHNAKSGISSDQVIKRVMPAVWLVVSAGSNDPDNQALENNLQDIRDKATNHVIWIVPLCCERAKRLVLETAKENGDKMVTFTRTNDGTHPKYLRPLALQIRSAMK